MYFINWWFDSLIIGGLSILTWLIFTTFHIDDTSTIGWLSIGLSVLVNYPHFSATIYRLYQKPENIREFPVTAWGVPVLLSGAVGACLCEPRVVAPYFLMLFLLWSPYHYSGQAIGITMVYARRAGLTIGRAERFALSAFIFSAFLCGTIRLALIGVSNGSIKLYGTAVPTFPAPGWLYPAAASVMCTGALVFVGFVVAWCLRQRRILPPIVLLPAATHFIWFIAAADVKAFWVLVPFFHGLQYLLIAVAMQLKLRIGGEGERSWRRIRDEVLRWWSRNVVGGALLFVAPVVLFSVFPVPGLPVAAILLAAVNIHHFFVDGVIWKLRDPATASALSVNIGELAGTTTGVPAMARS